MSTSPKDRIETLLEQALNAADPSAELERLCGADKELHAKAVAALEQYRRLDQGTELEQAGGDYPERIGSYRLIRKLGEGGMGVVFLAEHEFLKRHVALKLIRPELHLSQTTKQRFQREAFAIARLQHESIVTIHDAGEVQGTVYLAMELIEGQSLDERLAASEAIPVQEALRIVRDIARGLEAAHAAGVLHRDIKPSNIRIDKNGRARLLDFGLAQAEGASQLTHTGAFQGTPAYASPEQIDSQGRAIDGRSDLYSLGVVFYELLTRQSPYKVQGTLELFHAILSVVPQDVRSLRAELDPQLAELVMKLLAKRREERPSTAAEVARALDPQLAAVKASTPQAVRGLWIWIGAALALATLLIAWQAGSGKVPMPIERHLQAVLGVEGIAFGQRLSNWEQTVGSGAFGDDEDSLGVVGVSLDGLTHKALALPSAATAVTTHCALIADLDGKLGRAGLALE
ncbi:MAG: serine/threonine-protein kinase [Planctomycetia bacterium]